MLKIYIHHSKNFIIKSISILLISSFLLTCSISYAGWIRDYIADGCEKDQSLHISLTKNILGIFYNIKNKIKSGALNPADGEKIWKEEADNFLDFLHEQIIRADKDVWSKESTETRRLLKLSWRTRNAAVLHTASEFYGRDSMPTDSRLLRVFIEKCSNIALGLNESAN